MRFFDIRPIALDLFDGEGAAAGASAEAPQGESNSTPAPTRRAKGEYANVVFGKQEQQAEEPATEQPTEASKNSAVQTTSKELDDRARQWRTMVDGEYKDLYAQDIQRIIDRRFRESKTLQAKVDSYQPIIDVLAQRYGETDADKLAEKINSDTAYWSEAAEEAGMSVEQYKEMQRLQRENKALQEAQRRAASAQAAEQKYRQWMGEADALKAKYAGFDLNAETQNPQFVSLLQSGVPMEHAYKVIHMDELVHNAMSTAAAQTEQRVTDNIRARGARPAEAGVAAQGGYTVKDDVSKLTRKDRAEIARRAARGEIIRF